MINNGPILNVFSEVDLRDGFKIGEKKEQLVSGESTLTAYQLKYRLCAFLPPLALDHVVESPILQPFIQLLAGDSTLANDFRTPKEWALLVNPHLPESFPNQSICAGALGRYLSRDLWQLQEILNIERIDNPQTPGFLWKTGLKSAENLHQGQASGPQNALETADSSKHLLKLLLVLFEGAPPIVGGMAGSEKLADLLQSYAPSSSVHPISIIALGRFFRDQQKTLEEHFVVNRKNARSGPGYLWRLQSLRTVDYKESEEVFDLTPEWVALFFWDEQVANETVRSSD